MAKEIKDIELFKISVVTDNYKPVNGKSVLIKAENDIQIIFKAEKVIEGKAFGTFMIANEVDKQGHYYTVATVKKAAEEAAEKLAKGEQIKFNLNHKDGDLQGVYLEKSIYNEERKAWEGWVNFSENKFLIQKAEEGKFHGFSIEGVGVIIQKALTLKETITNEQAREKLIKPLYRMADIICEILQDEEMPTSDKVGNLQVNVSQLNDLLNSEIDSIFNNEQTEIIKSEENSMDEKKVAEMAADIVLEKLEKAKQDDAAKEKQAEVKKAEEERITNIEKSIEDIKKAVTSSKSIKDQGKKDEINKAEETKGFEL